MTRINCVHPDELTVRHLVAEYRELPRIFTLVKKAQNRGLTPVDIMIPNVYVLGTGHVRFFYNKLKYLETRQQMLIDEMRKRGFKPNFINLDELMTGINQMWYNDWIPDDDAMKINRQRISERLNK